MFTQTAPIFHAGTLLKKKRKMAATEGLFFN